MTLNTTLNALADPTRRTVIQLLKKKDLSAGEIAKHFTISLPSLSHHLNILKAANLVSSRRDGQNIIYSLNLSVIDEIIGELYGIIGKK